MTLPSIDETLPDARAAEQLAKLVARRQQSHSQQIAIGRLPVAILLAVASAMSAMLVSFVIDFQSRDISLVDHIASSIDSKLSAGAHKSHYMSRIQLDRERERRLQAAYLQNVIMTNSRKVTVPEAERYADIIIRESHRQGLDPVLVAAVIKAESTFRKQARSHVGARGLMQIMPATGEYIAKLANIPWKGVGALYEPEYNITLGIAYLKYLENYFGTDRYHLLVAYNWGPTNTRKALKTKQKRVPKVSRYYARGILANTEKWNSSLALRQLRS